MPRSYLCFTFSPLVEASVSNLLCFFPFVYIPFSTLSKYLIFTFLLVRHLVATFSGYLNFSFLLPFEFSHDIENLPIPGHK